MAVISSFHLLDCFLIISCFSFVQSLSVPFRAEDQIRVEETPAETFARSDGNHDGKLNFDEFMRTDALFEALKRDEFSQLDANSDGKVSREEYYPSGGWYRGSWTAGSATEILPLQGVQEPAADARKQKEAQAAGQPQKLRVEKRALLKENKF